MSLTSLIFLAIFALGLFLTLQRTPIYGLLTYLWAFYNSPLDRWWGASLPNLRWSLVASLVTLIATASKRPPLMRFPWHANWGIRILIAFTVWLWIQNIWALDEARHWFVCTLFTKYILFFYVICRLVSDEKDLGLLYWAHVLGCFIWGWEAYHTTGAGRLETIGGSDVSGANGAATQLLIGLIFAGFMLLGQRRIGQWVLLAVIPFILNAIILTGTRGAFLGMIGSAVATLFFAPRSHRFRIYVVCALAVVLLFRLGNDVFWDRMGTIQSTKEGEMEKSALSRFAIARANWRMSQDYPMGVGHGGNELLSPNYIPGEYMTSTGTRAAHNTFMAVLVDHGYPGAILFILLYIWALISSCRLGLPGNSLDEEDPDPRIRLYAAALGPAIIA
jgi:O-Antigen ligase